MQKQMETPGGSMKIKLLSSQANVAVRSKIREKKGFDKCFN